MGVIYKKIGFWNKATEHFEAALEIRKKLVGPLSLGVADIHEKIGKV